jgi:hypothetical protein
VFGSLDRYEKALKLSDENFKQVIGVKKQTFEVMVEILTLAYQAKHKRRGRHAKLSIQDMLLMTLKYWRQYVTQLELSIEFQVGEATTHDVIVWVENSLAKSKKFSLLGRGALLEHPEIEIVLVDVTESPIERPKKTSDNGIVGKRNVTRLKRS